jgi:hypothetical protein
MVGSDDYVSVRDWRRKPLRLHMRSIKDPTSPVAKRIEDGSLLTCASPLCFGSAHARVNASTLLKPAVVIPPF